MSEIQLDATNTTPSILVERIGCDGAPIMNTTTKNPSRGKNTLLADQNRNTVPPGDKDGMTKKIQPVKTAKNQGKKPKQIARKAPPRARSNKLQKSTMSSS